MKTISKICLYCNEQFDAELREVNRGNGNFCSLVCARKDQGRRRPKPESNVQCAYCSTLFYKNLSAQKNSRSRLYFCCRSHKDLAQRIEFGLKDVQPNHYNDGLSYYRTIAKREFALICNRCGYEKNPVALIVHHKDRNRNNNSLTNLEILCANCHAIEHWSKSSWTEY